MPPPDKGSDRGGVSHYFQTDGSAAERFSRCGYPGALFFPHRVYRLPRSGPGGLEQARTLGSPSALENLWQIVLYAVPPATEGFPDELFLDDDIQWHRQHFGRVGQIAFATLSFDGARVFVTRCVSDLVERVPPGNRHRAEVDRRFSGWGQMLMNAVMGFAVDQGAVAVYSPQARLVSEKASSSGGVEAEHARDHFYDAALVERFAVEAEDGWWRIQVEKNLPRIVALTAGAERIDRPGTTICLCHDTERGWGHLASDPAFAKSIEPSSRVALDEMLRVERNLGVQTTYNVLGVFFDEVRSGIEGDGHALAFHSYDHVVESAQLKKCREVDERVKGYRPPQSKITTELTDAELLLNRFEWFACAPGKIHTRTPRMEHGIVKIPVLFDDFSLYSRKRTFGDWEEEALRKVEGASFAALGLHDCYAEYWLPYYERFLEKLRERGSFRTLDEVAAEVVLCSARGAKETMVRPQRPRQSRLKQGAFLAAAVLLVLLLCELSLQLLCVLVPASATVFSKDFGRATKNVDDPVLGHRLNPALPDNDASGFRNASLPESVRIVAIGDSQTYGTCTARENAWPQRIEARTGLTTYSMAVGGYGTAHYLALVDEALALEPELVIVGSYLGNDLKEAFHMVHVRGQLTELKTKDARALEEIRMAQSSGFGGPSAWRELNVAVAEGRSLWFRRRSERPLFRFVEQYCRLYGLGRATKRIFQPLEYRRRTDRRLPPKEMVRDVVASLDPEMVLWYEHDEISTVFTPRLRKQSLDLNDPRIAEGLRISIEALRQIARKVRGKADLLVVLIPTKELVFSELLSRTGASVPESLDLALGAEREVRAQMKAFLDSHGIRWVDVLPALRAHFDRGENPYFCDWETHPNSAATDDMASLIIDNLPLFRVQPERQPQSGAASE